MNRVLLVIVSFLTASAVISAQESTTSTTTSPATVSDTATTALPAAGSDDPTASTYLACVERACPASMECYGSITTRKDFNEEKWSTDFDYVWRFVASVPCLEKAIVCVCSSECASLDSPWAVQERVCNQLSGDASGSGSDPASGSDGESGSDSDSGSDSKSGSDSDSGSDTSDSASGSDSESGGSVCCEAMTVECLSCAAGMHVDHYCELHPDTVGCPKPCLIVDCAPGYELVDADDRGCGGECRKSEACCDAVNAECEACNAGVSVEEMCRRHPDLDGCPQNNLPACIATCFTSDADMPATTGDWCIWAKGARELKCTKGCDDEVWRRQAEFLETCAGTDDKPCAAVACSPDHDLVGADEKGCGGECRAREDDGPPACLKACFPDGGFPDDPEDLCAFARAAPKKPCFAPCLDDKRVMDQREEFLRRCEESGSGSGSGSSSSSGSGDDSRDHQHCTRCAISFKENGGCELMKTGSADAVEAAIPEGCNACGDEAARVCGMEDEGDSAHCRECAEEFVRKGGCEALKDPEKVKALIPYGCMPCGEAAARMCFDNDETDSSDSDSDDDDDNEGPPRCIAPCFKDGAIPMDPRFAWCEWLLLDDDKPANCMSTCSAAVMEEKKEFERHCKEVLHLPEGDDGTTDVTCSWPADAAGQPRRYVLEVLRHAGSEKLKTRNKAFCEPIFFKLAESVVAGARGLEDALLLNRTALEGICLPACPVEEMLNFVDDELQNMAREGLCKSAADPVSPSPPTTTTTDDGERCRRCATQFHAAGGCDAMRSGDTDKIRSLTPAGCDACAEAAAYECFGDTAMPPEAGGRDGDAYTSCAAAACPAAVSCYSDSVASRMMFNEERWVHDVSYVDEMVGEVGCLKESIACVCSSCGYFLEKVWPVAKPVCAAVGGGPDRRLESEPLHLVESVERTLSDIHGAVERARDLHEVLCAHDDTEYDDHCERCATEFMTRGGCEAWGDEKKTRSLIPSGCEPCEKMAAKFCGHVEEEEEEEEEEGEEETNDTALCLAHLADLDAQKLCTTGCAKKIFSKFDLIFSPILGDKTKASEVLGDSLCGLVNEATTGEKRYCTDLMRDVDEATDADRVLAAAPGLCVENAAGERPCLDAARAIADRFGNGARRKVEFVDFCASPAAAAGEKVRTDTKSELMTDHELSKDEEKAVCDDMGAKIRQRVAAKLKLGEDRVFVLVTLRKAKAARRMRRALSAANSYTASSTIVVSAADAASLPPAGTLFRDCVQPAAAETAAVTAAAATASDASSAQVAAAAFSFDKGEDITETPAAGGDGDDEEEEEEEDSYLLGFSKQTIFIAAAGAAGVIVGAAVLAVAVRRRNRSGRAMQRRRLFRLNEVEGAAANPAGKIELYDGEASAKV